MSSKFHSTGFTLVELLIALVILAIIGLMTASGLRQMITANQRMQATNKMVTEMEFATALLQRDISQIIARPIRDADGNLTPAILSVNGIEFSTASYSLAFDDAVRSNIQRIAYHVEAGNLVRLTYPVLDRAPTTQPQSRILLHNVTSFSVSYIDNQGQAQDGWPPPTILGGFVSQGFPMPSAIVVILGTREWGTFKMVIATPQDKFYA